MDGETMATLRDEKRKAAQIRRERQRRRSASLRKNGSDSRLDMERHPFCEERQRNDLKESRMMGRNPSWARARKQRSKGLLQGELDGNKLAGILRDTMQQLQHDAIGSSGAPAPRTKKGPRPQSPSFGHRPGSASRHVDVLMFGNQDIKRQLRDLPRAGLMKPDDLHRLVHAPVQAAKTKRATPRCRNPGFVSHPQPWNSALFDDLVEDKRKGQRPFSFQVNAVHGSSRAGFKQASNETRSRAAGRSLNPLCLDRQLSDLEHRALDNYFGDFDTRGFECK